LLIKICAARSERSLSLFLKALPLQTFRRALFSFGGIKGEGARGGLAFLKRSPAWVFKKEP